jgi:hypothetical protein
MPLLQYRSHRTVEAKMPTWRPNCVICARRPAFLTQSRAAQSRRANSAPDGATGNHAP